MDEGVIDGGRLKTTMEHAVGTLGIATVAIVVPARFFDQGLETGGIPFFRQQITRPLPAEDIPSRIPPWGACVGLISGQKVEEECRLIESPFSTFTQVEDLPE
jgi:hypothetical protein